MNEARVRHEEIYNDEPRMLGVDCRVRGPLPTPPPRDGTRLAVTKEGFVAMLFSEPRDEVTMTPDQAQALARGLLKWAKKARKVKS